MPTVSGSLSPNWLKTKAPRGFEKRLLEVPSDLNHSYPVSCRSRMKMKQITVEQVTMMMMIMMAGEGEKVYVACELARRLVKRMTILHKKVDANNDKKGGK